MQWRVLHDVQGSSQEGAQASVACADVVETRVDGAMVDQPHGLPREKSLDALHGIGADMRREPVAQRIGQPVDQGDVAEDVALPEVGAVCLEGVQPIWREGHDVAAGLGHSHHLRGGGAVVRDVLDHFIGEDQVEVVIRIGEVLAHREHDVGQLGTRLRHAFRFDLDAVDVFAVLAEAPHVRADAAAHIEHPRPLKIHESADHLQPSVLAIAPGVAGPAALDGRGGRLFGLLLHRPQRYGTRGGSAGRTSLTRTAQSQ